MLTPGEVHFLVPLGRTWRGDPLIREHGGATVKVMIRVGCKPTHMDTALGHLIQGLVGTSSVEQWSANGHGDAWGCVVVCWTVMWNGSASHCIEYMRGVTATMTLAGQRTIQDGIAIA